MRFSFVATTACLALGCTSEFGTASSQSENSGGTTSSDAIVTAAGIVGSVANAGSAGGLATFAPMAGRPTSTNSSSGGGSGGATETSSSTIANAGASAGGGRSTLESPCGALRNDEAYANAELCIVAGSFVMGSQNSNLGSGHADHTPPHLVTLSTFAIDAFEVTIGRYRACLSAGRCSAPSIDASRGCSFDASSGQNDGMPVNCVTAAQAEQFCAWDDNRRLPTEAEWERTARGTDGRTFPWGAAFSCSYAVVAGNAACARSHHGIAPVGSILLGVSPEGAYDMAGNVAEWVKDLASAYPTGAVTDPTGPAYGGSRILRGGSFSSNSPDAQTYVRMTTTASTIGAYGFRCARSVPN